MLSQVKILTILKSCSIIVFKYIEKLLFIIHLLGKYLLRAYYMPGTVVGPKNIAAQYIFKGPPFMMLVFLKGQKL